MTDDILNSDRKELREALQLEISATDFAKLEKQANDLAGAISDGLLYDIKENLASWLADHVQSSAASAINAIINGNDREARRYLGLKPEVTYDGREHAARPWFDGTTQLHEFGGLALRRKIVEAHRDLITDERVADLEAQLKGLISTYHAMEHGTVPAMRAALREAEAFMSGFEGDPLQDGMSGRLKLVRDALAKAGER